MRIEGNCFTAGNDWQDGSQGMEISISLPSPREPSHWFFPATPQRLHRSSERHRPKQHSDDSLAACPSLSDVRRKFWDRLSLLVDRDSCAELLHRLDRHLLKDHIFV